MVSVDLSGYPDFYNAISDPKNVQYYNDLQKENLIFDEKTKTVWIQWYNEGVA